jgi:hypothetical protein
MAWNPVFKVYGTGKKANGDKARRRWLATFMLEADAYQYQDMVRKANPTWAVEVWVGKRS